MIRVTIEMVPGGIEEAKYPMHVIEIWNDLTRTMQNRKYGDYEFQISWKLSEAVIEGRVPIRWHRKGKVENFPRAAKNVVHLLKVVLEEAYR